MFPAQRIEILKRILKEQKTVDIATLCNMLQVSNVTVRKYLDQLEEEGFLIKSHGGAMLAEQYDNSLIQFIQESQEDKDHIANLAKTIIEDGESIFIGAGSTCLALARKVIDLKNLTVVTNNVNALIELAPHIRNLQFVGGEISYDNGLMFSYGHKAMRHLEGMFVQKAFMSVQGVDFTAGLTSSDFETLDIFNKINMIAKKVVILADYTKFNKVSLHQIAHLTDYDIYISNEKLDSEFKKFFFDHNIKILTSYNI